MGGAFAGVWLGGYVFDTTGSYAIVWWLAVLPGLVAPALHLPIAEAPVRLHDVQTEAAKLPS